MCWEERRYDHRIISSFFVVLFIPFHSKTDESLECRTCGVLLPPSMRELHGDEEVSRFKSAYRATMEVALHAVARALPRDSDPADRMAKLRGRLMRRSVDDQPASYRDGDRALAGVQRLHEGATVADALGGVPWRELPDLCRREIVVAAQELVGPEGLDFDTNEALSELIEALELPDDVLAHGDAR